MAARNLAGKLRLIMFFTDKVPHDDSFDIGGGIFLTSSTFVVASKIAEKVRVMMTFARRRW